MRLLFIILVILTFGCSEPFNPKVEISLGPPSEKEIQVKAETNFPENTSLTITASREYKRQGSDVIYSTSYYSSIHTRVKNGQVSFSFDPTDKGWIKEYEKLRNSNGYFDKTLTEIDYNTIKDTIEISILFTPKGENPENVVKVVGVDGKNLKGDGVEIVNREFKIYNKTLKFFHKYDTN